MYICVRSTYIQFYYLHLYAYTLVSTYLYVGGLPSTVGGLTALKYLSLHANDLAGSLPTEIGLMTALTFFSIEDGDVTGTYVQDVCMYGVVALLSIFIYVHGMGQLSQLSRNSHALPFCCTLCPHPPLLSRSYILCPLGTLPTHVGSLTNLVVLNVGSNKMIGMLVCMQAQVYMYVCFCLYVDTCACVS